ncbi:MAG: hypothetical protein OXG13_01200 [Gemmatimonadaceae bacterium]|nr:hypothetical protein [Gemmatimonadaceae bacterium]
MQARKNILLIEPGYANKYPPLGLMKLAAYHGQQGRGDQVSFVKGSNRRALEQRWDRVYITTLFSFEWKKTAAAIDFGIQAAAGQNERVFVGGVAASLMHEQFLAEPRWAGVRFIRGLLDGPPATALMLSEEEGDFGAGDLHSTPIEEMIPDYGILDQLAGDYVYPVRDAYFGYASRGCVRKCAFCGVPKLEGAQREMPPLARLVEGISTAHGEKKDLILMDNNITASARYKEVIAEIRDLGFTPGATLQRPGARPVQRRVDFNQGVDARILCKSPMYLREMATICISPLRIAFDHMGVRRVYETSVRMAADNSITSLSNYMLYNFMDSPGDLYERMRLNISLNEELGLRIWSFPMRYQPVTLKERTHVGERWNRYYLRSFQIMLQATRGVVSGSPSFFCRAYGESPAEFQRLLSLPHAFIFHREFYENPSSEGRAVLDDYIAARGRLSASQEEELVNVLGGTPDMKTVSLVRFKELAEDRALDRQIREVLHFHAWGTRDRPIGEPGGGVPLFAEGDRAAVIPEDERIEDAGLFGHDDIEVEEGMGKSRVPSREQRGVR